MTELRYPAFPRRAFLAAGTALLALMAAAIIVNRSAPTVGGCARAAERVMASRNLSVTAMRRAGQGSVSACRGLSGAQYGQALLDTYRIEFGRRLPRVPVRYAIPPPSYKARSANGEFRAQR